MRARKAVVSNVDVWNTRKLIDAAVSPQLAAEFEQRAQGAYPCDSFLL